MKNILICFSFLMITLSSYAQEEVGFRKESIHKRKDFLLSLLLGRGQFASPIIAPSSNTGAISNETPNSGVLNGNGNALINMAGVEARYFLTPQIALRASGGVIFSNTPSQESITGLPNTIPEVETVTADERIDLNFSVGSEYHFITKSKRVSPYAGLAIPFIYGKHSKFNPGVKEGGDVIDVYGTRNATIFGVGGQTYFGVDYFFNKEVYIGFQINVAGATYTRVDKSGGKGFDTSKASTTQANFLTQPVLKFGFKLW